VIEKIVGGTVSWVEILARLDIDWRWRGVLHEVLRSPESATREKLRGLRLDRLAGGARSAIGLHEKYARDADILRVALASEPDNTRYRFYLAQSLRESGQWVAALEAYRQRSVAGGWDEEVYFSKLMIGVLSEQVGATDAEVVEAYLDAWRFRPQRAETPTRLAHFLIKRQRYAQAGDCARAALALPQPSDTLLVEKAAYGWRPRDDLAIALFHLGDEAGCIDVYRQMLADPQLPASERERVQCNLDRLAPLKPH
jgi:hypothetical protein